MCVRAGVSALLCWIAEMRQREKSRRRSAIRRPKDQLLKQSGAWAEALASDLRGRALALSLPLSLALSLSLSVFVFVGGLLRVPIGKLRGPGTEKRARNAGTRCQALSRGCSDLSRRLRGSAEHHGVRNPGRLWPGSLSHVPSCCMARESFVQARCW